jgi:hypothetical protein
MAKCKAFSRSTKARCKQSVVPGLEVCRFHGGATPRGVASANFKHGRYSKAIPDRLVGMYEKALSDEDLIALRDEIALIDARLSELLATVDDAVSGSSWSDIDKLIERRRKLCDSERRRILDLQLVLTAEQATALMAAIVQVIRDRTKEFGVPKEYTAAIIEDFRRLMERNK